jgi:hypothetical protein
MVVAAILMLLAILSDFGSPLFSKIVGTLPDVSTYQGKPVPHATPAPGLGIKYLALLDGILFYSLVLMCFSQFSGDFAAKLAGLPTVIVSLIALIASVILAIVAFILLLIMVSLFLAIPFGTIIYLALYGAFNSTAAATALSCNFVLKLVFIILLIFISPKFLEGKSLILMILTVFLGNVLLSFLHGLVPSILDSITDTIGALVIAILAILWTIYMLVTSVLSTLRFKSPV